MSLIQEFRACGCSPYTAEIPNSYNCNTSANPHTMLFTIIWNPYRGGCALVFQWNYIRLWWTEEFLDLVSLPVIHWELTLSERTSTPLIKLTTTRSIELLLSAGLRSQRSHYYGAIAREFPRLSFAYALNCRQGILEIPGLLLSRVSR